MDAQPRASPVRIGLLHSLSGTMAISEAPLLDAEQLAIDDLNGAGGVLGCPIEPLVADGASTPEAFAEGAERLLACGAVALFGCWTSACRKAVKPIVEAADCLLWYPIHYEGLEESQRIVYVGACLNQQTIPAIEWALENAGRRVYLLGTDHVFSRAASRLARSLIEAYPVADHPALVVGERYLPFGEQDFAAVIDAIREEQPDLVFNTMNGDCNPAFYRQYHAAGLSARDVPILSVSVSETELHGIADVAAGHLACWNYFQSLDNAANREFVAKFQARFGADRVCSAPMVSAYCQVLLWRQAVEAAGSWSTAAVRRRLAGQRLDGPAGVMVIEPNQHITTQAHVGRYGSDGQFEVLWSSSGPMLPLPWLGVERTDLLYSALIREAMASYPDVLDYAARLERQIAERERTGEALRQSDERFRVALQSSPVMVSHQDLELRYTWVHNPARPFGPHDLLGRTDADLFSPRDADLLTALKQRVLATSRGERSEVELHVDGTTVVWDLTIEPLRNTYGDLMGITCASMDMTIRKRFEESLRERLEEQVREQTGSLLASNAALDERARQLRGMAAELTMAEERQRRELGGVLHDHVQQLLVGALMHIDAMLQQVTIDPVRETGCRIRQIISDAVAATRSLTWGLSPTVLYHLGLGAALHGLAKHSSEQYGLVVDVETDPLAEPESETVLVLLFRSVQELLLNVVKHAKVDRASVRLVRRQTDELQVEVSDQGVGFDPQLGMKPGAHGGCGLVSLRERLAHLGGRIEVESAPGAGTLVRLIASLDGGPLERGEGQP